MENTQTREIPLTRGQIAIVDAKHYDRIVAMGHWNAYLCRDTGCYYARKTIQLRFGLQKSWKNIHMHRVVLGAPPGILVHHVCQSDTLRNTEENLRLATSRQNNSSTRMRSTNISGFRGVYMDGRSHLWIAKVNLEGGEHWRRYFRAKEAAARAYDAKAREVYGEFAVLNFPEASQ